VGIPNSLPNPYLVKKPLPFPIYLREGPHAKVEIDDKQKGEKYENPNRHPKYYQNRRNHPVHIAANSLW
jgi:hypothetical protein